MMFAVSFPSQVINRLSMEGIDDERYSAGGSPSKVNTPRASLLVASRAVVVRNDAGERTVPARLTVRVCATLGDAARAIDFVRVRKDQQLAAVEVHKRV